MNHVLLPLLFVLFALPSIALADGKSDYKAFCAGCHGANGNMQTEKAKALKMDIKKLSLKVSKKSKAEMVAIIKKGKGDMPDFEKNLPDKQIKAIVDYVISLRTE